MSKDGFYCHNCGCSLYLRMEAGNGTKHPTIQRTAPPSKELHVPNVNSAQVETSLSRARHTAGASLGETTGSVWVLTGTEEPTCVSHMSI